MVVDIYILAGVGVLLIRGHFVFAFWGGRVF